MRPHRPLVIAEAANPDWVSVPLVGWSLSRALLDACDAHLVTHVRNKDAVLKTGLAAERVTFIDSERVAVPLWKLSRLLRGGSGTGWTTATALSALSYYYFEHLVWKRFRDAIRAGEFDVVHRVTPLTPTAPSRIATRCRRAGTPFVLGPLNGGLPWPKEFDAARRQEREWLSYVRGAYRLLPGYRSTRRDAAAIIVGSEATRDQMPSWVSEKCVYVPENGIDPARFEARPRAESRGPLRAVFVGRLVPYKGADMLLEAAGPLLAGGGMRLDIVGDGPLRESLEETVASAGLESAVTLHGWVPHEQVQDHLAIADILAFPSIREFGGGVVLEAMTLGVVPVVVDYGGPGELVTEDTGFAIPLGSREEITVELRAALERIVVGRESLAAMSERCKARVRDLFTWEAKARQILAVHQWVLGRAERPDFAFRSAQSDATRLARSAER